MSTRNRVVLFIVIGVVLIIIGAVATVLLINRINANTRLAQEQSQTVKSAVVVMAHDMKLGDRLQAADLTISQVPVELIPRDAVTAIDQAVDKIIKSDVVQGEMLLQHNVADPTNNTKDLSFVLAPDHVLMAFPATDLMSRENIPQRGDIVDILATFDETVKQVGTTTTTTTTTNPADQQPVTRTFTVNAFQKISVTALVLDVVAQQNTSSVSTQNNNQAPAQTTISSYLLALSPQDALVLKHLKDIGAIFDVVIRNPTSNAQFELTPVTQEYIVELYGLEILP